MADTDNNLPAKKVSKKDLRKQVFEKLAAALSEYKAGINEKKFDNRLKKVSRIFAQDIAKAVKSGKRKNREKNIVKN
jgi:hypothetical protein